MFIHFQRSSAVSFVMLSATETPLHSRLNDCVALSYTHSPSGEPSRDPDTTRPV